jgi:hypothetical protein
MSELKDYLNQTLNDQTDREFEQNQDRAKRADTVAYYEGSDAEPYGLLLNRKLWICNDCKMFFAHPQTKYRSLLDDADYYKGAFVCSKCKGRHGYNPDPKDTKGSVAYYHDVWELTTYDYQGNLFILPKMFHQLSTYPLFTDLESLLWVRKRMTNSTLANETPEVAEIAKILHAIRLFHMKELTLEESLDVFWRHQDMPRAAHYVPVEIYAKDRAKWQNMAESLYLQIIYPGA